MQLAELDLMYILRTHEPLGFLAKRYLSPNYLKSLNMMPAKIALEQGNRK